MVIIRKKWRFLAVNLKVYAGIVERLDTSHSNVKIEEIKMVIITVAIRLVECFEIIVASQDMSSKTVSNSRKGTHASTIILVIVIEKTLSHKTWFSRRHCIQYKLNDSLHLLVGC
jgi:hypothetical protein